MDDAGGNSLVVQWLGLRTFNALAQDQSLVGEQGSCKSRGTAKTKQNTTIKKKKKPLDIVEARVQIGKNES